MVMMRVVGPVKVEDRDDLYYECRTLVRELISRGYFDECLEEEKTLQLLEKRKGINSKDREEEVAASSPPKH